MLLVKGEWTVLHRIFAQVQQAEHTILENDKWKAQIYILLILLKFELFV